MPNSFHEKPAKGSPPKAKPGQKATNMPMKTASWAGLPGKTQPRTRDKTGTRKVGYVKSEGI